MLVLTVVYAGTSLLFRVSSVEQYLCQGKPIHKAFRASEGVKASRIQVIITTEEYMTEQEVIDKTNKVFEESFEIEKERLVPEANIFVDLGLDSLDIVDLIVALQSSFGVKIRNEEKVRDIRTLQDLYQFISSIKNDDSVKNS